MQAVPETDEQRTRDALRDRWWREARQYASAAYRADHFGEPLTDNDFERISNADTALVAGAPTGPTEDPDWPGGWVLVDDEGHQLNMAGVDASAWPTEAAAAEAAARHNANLGPQTGYNPRRRAHAIWSAVSQLSGVQVLDRPFWEGTRP